MTTQELKAIEERCEKATPIMKIYWLIENRDPDISSKGLYFMEDIYGSIKWTNNPQRAFKFPSYEMAKTWEEKVLRICIVEVCEHGFFVAEKPYEDIYALLAHIKAKDEEIDTLRSRLADLEARSRWVSEVPREG